MTRPAITTPGSKQEVAKRMRNTRLKPMVPAYFIRRAAAYFRLPVMVSRVHTGSGVGRGGGGGGGAEAGLDV